MEWRVARAALLCLLLGVGSSGEVVEVRWGKDLQLPAGVVLRGLDETRSIPFSVPAGRVVKSARVILSLRHSPALIDPSSLTVAVNGTPLSTVKLTPTNAAGVTVEAAIPPTLLKDYNQLQLLGAQHYTTACEDPFEASLWTAMSSDSRLVFDFGPYRHFPTLNEFPRPLADPLDYRQAVIRFVVPAGAAASTYGVMSGIAGELGRRLEFRPARLRVVAALQLDADESQIILGTAGELRSLPEALPWLEPLPAGSGLGLLRLLENPKKPGRFLLIVSGQDSEGLEKGAMALLRHPEMRALSAATAVIEQVDAATAPPRPDFLPRSDSFTLRRLLPESNPGGITVRGFNPGPIDLRLRPLGNERFVRYEQRLRLEYAYGPQVDISRSTLEVVLNGKALRGEALTRPAGSASEVLVTALPDEALAMDNLLQVQFHLYPRNWNYCEKFSNDFLWATLYGSSSFNMPRDRYADMPDLALLRHSGYPFSDEPAALLLPPDPRPEEASLAANVALWLGRVAGRSPQVAYFDDRVPDSVLRTHHLLAVALPHRSALLRQAAEQLTLHYASPGLALRTSPAGGLAARLPSMDGFVEEAVSPWNSERVLLVFSGATPAGLDVAGVGLNDPGLRPQIAGSLVLFHLDGELSSFLPAKTVRFGGISFNRRVKYWVLDHTAWLAVISLITLACLFLLLRFLRRRYFLPEEEEEEEAAEGAST